MVNDFGIVIVKFDDTGFSFLGCWSTIMILDKNASKV